MIPWKNFFYSVLGIFLPLVYSWFIGKFPGFPLAEAAFVETGLYFIGLLIGGWQLNTVRLKYFLKRDGMTYVDDVMIERR